MTPMPAESRILTALLLAPMDASSLAIHLSLDVRHIHRHLSIMNQKGEVRPKDHAPSAFGSRAIRYALTRKGIDWAQELVA